MDEVTPAPPRSQVSQAIWAIKWAAALALAGCFLYGIFGRQCGSAGWGCSLTGGLVAALAATGAFAVGALLGLLFGAPRYKEGTPAASEGGDKAAPGVGHNTSLERIADWLTTMIVGLGLVHLGRIKTEAGELGVALTQAITLGTSPNGSPGIVIALGLGIAGFLLVYLWSLRFLPNELLAAFQKMRRDVVEAKREIQAKTDQIEKAASVLEDFKKSPVFTVPPSALQALAADLRGAAVPQTLVDEICSRYEGATRWMDEPMRGFGPAAAGEHRLEAEVRQLSAGWYEVTVTLRGPHVPGGRIVWLGHNTFSPDVARIMPVRPEGTRYDVQVSGAFIIGAVLLKPGEDAVTLSLDLRGTPGSTPEFDNG